MQYVASKNIETQEECNVVFESDLNKDVSRIAILIIHDMKKHLDISAKLIIEIINDENTIRLLNFIQKQLFMVLVKDARYLNCNVNADKCGKIINIHKNGFKEYCNIHKYYHINDSTLILSQDKLCSDHIFIQKTSEQLEEEMQQVCKVTKYQLYLDTLYKDCYNIIMHFIKSSSIVECVDIFDIESLKNYHNEIISGTTHCIFKDRSLSKSNNRKYINVYRYINDT